MTEYLSADWIARVDAAMKSDQELMQLCQHADLTLQQEVHGGPYGDVIFHLTLSSSGASIQSGPAARPDVVLRQTHATAVSVRSGEMNALDGVQTGAIVLSGEVASLTAHRQVLAQLEAAFTTADINGSPTELSRDRGETLK